MITAIIPIKRLDTAKRRLSDILSPDERKRLCIAMLRDVLEVLGRLPQVTEICIVTPDDELPSLIGRDTEQNQVDHNKVKIDYAKVRVIREPEQTDLNSALLYARAKVSGNGDNNLLYIPGDIPLVKTDELEALIENLGYAPNPNGGRKVWAVIVPDKATVGTNFLLLHPPDLIAPCFGPNSFQEHLQRIRGKKIPYKVGESFGVSWDIDTPEDLETLYRYGYGTRSYEALRDLG